MSVIIVVQNLPSLPLPSVAIMKITTSSHQHCWLEADGKPVASNTILLRPETEVGDNVYNTFTLTRCTCQKNSVTSGAYKEQDSSPIDNSPIDNSGRKRKAQSTRTVQRRVTLGGGNDNDDYPSDEDGKPAAQEDYDDDGVDDKNYDNAVDDDDDDDAAPAVLPARTSVL